MAEFSRTWWGQRFIAALEQMMDSGRLGRGRSYARNGKVLGFKIDNGVVKAQVRGSVNPYFGVYKEPLYKTSIEFKQISDAKWSAAIALIASKASLISRLMLNEMPDTIESGFQPLGLNLLPHAETDLKTTCSCPDWSNPCKHIAGVYFLLAEQLDQDPFLLFELRGLSRKSLHRELLKSPLGQALSSELSSSDTVPQPDPSYYTKPTLLDPDQSVEMCASLRDFWLGEKRLPQTLDVQSPLPVSGILVKQQGDFPPFWERSGSFIDVAEEFYTRVRTKNADLF